MRVFRITSSTTFIFIYDRILWTNFKKLTVVVQKPVTEFRPELELSHVPKLMCSESRVPQLLFSSTVEFCDQTSKSWPGCSKNGSVQDHELHNSHFLCGHLQRSVLTLFFKKSIRPYRPSVDLVICEMCHILNTHSIKYFISWAICHETIIRW